MLLQRYKSGIFLSLLTLNTVENHTTYNGAILEKGIVPSLAIGPFNGGKISRKIVLKLEQFS